MLKKKKKSIEHGRKGWSGIIAWGALVRVGNEEKEKITSMSNNS